MNSLQPSLFDQLFFLNNNGRERSGKSFTFRFKSIEFAGNVVIQQLRGPNLPNFDPLPPRVDLCEHFTLFLPFVA